MVDLYVWIIHFLSNNPKKRDQFTDQLVFFDVRKNICHCYENTSGMKQWETAVLADRRSY